MLLLQLLWFTLFRDCGGGRFVRIGGNSEVPDYFAFVLHTPSNVQQKVQTFRKQELQTVEAEIQSSVGPNGLVLDDSTLRDGNCGLDAILRTIQSLSAEQRSPQMTDLLNVLEKHGRQDALHWLRLKLIGWLRVNSQHEVVPGMGLTEFVTSDTQASFNFDTLESYLSHMSKRGEWIDQTMLMAVTQVMGAHILIFNGVAEPYMISAVDDIRPILPIALAHQQHFWALQVASCGEHSVPDIVATREHRVEAERRGDNVLSCLIGNVAGEGVEGSIATDYITSETPGRPQQSEIEKVLKAEEDLTLLSVALCGWSPFMPKGSDDPSGEAIRTALQRSYPENNPDIYNVLRLRQVTKLLQLESYDTVKGERRELCYQAAGRYHLARKKTEGLYSIFKRSGHIAAALDIKRLTRLLAGSCSRDTKKTHTCLNDFRDTVNAVWKWRVCFYALPYADRERRIAQLFYDELQAAIQAQCGDRESFRMQYQFMGRPVCKEAFQMLTAIDKHAPFRGRQCGAADPPKLNPLARG